MLPFAEWSRSFLKTPIIYITICITIPSMALYIAQIVTIVRHKKFHNSFYALFVMRAIPDLLFVLNSFYGLRFLVGIVLNSIDPPTMPVIFIYHPLIMDTGTVVLSSWLLLWASGIFRQQLLKDFGIIRINNVQTIRVNAPEGPRNNKHWATNVSHQHTSSVQQMPTVS